jgi:uncharacterized protein DUF2846
MNNKKVLAALLALSTISGGIVFAQQGPAPAAQAGGKTGTVVFFRAKKFVAGGVGFKVRENDVELGRLRNGTYFIIHPTAGKHEYVVHAAAEDRLTLEIEPGETYYVQANVTMGALAGRPNLAPSDQATFEGLKSGIKDVTGQGIGDKD